MTNIKKLQSELADLKTEQVELENKLYNKEIELNKAVVEYVQQQLAKYKDEYGLLYRFDYNSETYDNFYLTFYNKDIYAHLAIDDALLANNNALIKFVTAIPQKIELFNKLFELQNNLKSRVHSFTLTNDSVVFIAKNKTQSTAENARIGLTGYFRNPVTDFKIGSRINTVSQKNIVTEIEQAIDNYFENRKETKNERKFRFFNWN